MRTPNKFCPVGHPGIAYYLPKRNGALARACLICDRGIPAAEVSRAHWVLENGRQYESVGDTLDRWIADGKPWPWNSQGANGEQ